MDINLALEITLVGMGVVFSTLLILMGIVLLFRLFSGLNSTRKEPDNLAPETATPAEIPSQHLAVIAAAVTAMGSGYRIRTIEIIGNDNWERSRFIENTL